MRLTSFDKVDLLASCAEVKTLRKISFAERDWSITTMGLSLLTSVSMAKSGFQLSGGMILQMPYLLALSKMLRIYAIGSRNSASVGLNVGASGSPCGLVLVGGSRLEGWPLRSTVRISSG